MGHAIVAEGLTKRYGTLTALDGLDLVVEEGTVLGVLGPNGAGKTTTVRVLATLLTPDEGRACVCGLDVVRDADELRALIGLSGQYAAVDETLTGRENLDMVARLYHLGRRASRQRADELLEQFRLTDAGRRPVKTYSGGMRRRLDLAASLVARPRVLFLDEPTTGLDPRSRNELWEVIRSLVAEGTTLLLTTQYLDEADALADRIAVIDNGRVIAEGTADQLKSRVGGERIEVVLQDPAALPLAAQVLCRDGGEYTVEDAGRRIAVPVGHGGDGLVHAVRELDAVGVGIVDVGLRRPTLDDVFFALTGHRAGAAPGSGVPDAETTLQFAADVGFSDGARHTTRARSARARTPGPRLRP